MVDRGVIWAAQDRPNEIARALLRHRDEVVRGTASLALDPGGSSHVPAVPAAWYADWAHAFEVAPLGSSLRHEHRLEEILERIVESDPDLVERWLTRALEADFVRGAFALRNRDEPILARLPRDHRDRLLRRFAHQPGRSQFLSLLLGDDAGWLGELLRDGVIDTDEALVALGNTGEDGVSRIPVILRLAPTFSSVGVQPEALASQAVFGVHMGPASAHAETLLAAYEGTSACADEAAENVRQAGIRVFTAERDRELERDRQRRIRGEL